MKKKTYAFFGVGFTSLWSAFVLLTMVLLLFFQRKTEYAVKTVFALPNSVLLLIGLSFLIIITALYVVFKDRIDTITEKIPSTSIYYLSALLFVVEAVVFYNMYFITDWDSGVVVAISKAIAADDYTGMSHPYISTYPNNIFLIWIYSVLFKLNSHLGDLAQAEYFIILFQCFGATLTGCLIFKVVKDITKPFCAYLAWIVYVFHVALNPWISILYSDAIVLCFPLSVLRVYQNTKNGKFILIKWFFIGMLSFVGYKIKPQVIIVTIAIIIVDVLRKILVSGKKEKMLSLGSYATVLISVILSAAICSNLIIPSLKIELDKTKETGMAHFLMMGLNSETDGVFLQSDVNFSGSFDSVEERNKNNIRVAKERIKDFGFVGLSKHLAKKNLVNYGDGTYAWAVEGTFYAKCFEDKNKTLSPFLKNLYYSKTGTKYQYFATFENLIWVTVVFCSGGVILYIIKKRNSDPTALVATLSLIGISLFQLIFEARARYLFLYSPFYIIVALLGWIGIVSTFMSGIKKISKNKVKKI